MQTGHTILLVDDDLQLLDTLSEVLRRRGYQVAIACHGQEALDYLNAGHRPQLILLDVSMPVMDGRAFLRMKNAALDLRDIPVLVFTAAADHVLPALAGQTVISKPCSNEELVAMVQSALANSPGRQPDL